MKIKVWIVTTTNPGQTVPCWPAPFGSEAEAEAHIDCEMRSEWEANGPEDPDTFQPMPYPGDWRAAHEAMVKADEAQGEWGRWEITSHEIEIGGIDSIAVRALQRIKSRLEGGWYDPTGDLESDIAVVVRNALDAVEG